VWQEIGASAQFVYARPEGLQLERCGGALKQDSNGRALNLGISPYDGILAAI
jgi:hypothetical protein